MNENDLLLTGAERTDWKGRQRRWCVTCRKAKTGDQNLEPDFQCPIGWNCRVQHIVRKQAANRRKKVDCVAAIAPLSPEERAFANGTAWLSANAEHRVTLTAAQSVVCKRCCKYIRTTVGKALQSVGEAADGHGDRAAQAARATQAAEARVAQATPLRGPKRTCKRCGEAAFPSNYGYCRVHRDPVAKQADEADDQAAGPKRRVPESGPKRHRGALLSPGRPAAALFPAARSPHSSAARFSQRGAAARG
jgi:hypothetical protein